MTQNIVRYYTELLEQTYGGKRWLVAMDVLPATTPIVDWLKRLGANAVLAVAAAPGTGPGPDPVFAPDPIVLDVEATDMMSAIRNGLRALAELPPDAVKRIDAFDPDGTVRVIGAMFDDGRPVGGRAKYGPRPAAWQALEDKTTVDALWDSIGAPRAPSEVVSLDDLDGLRSACQRLDEGDGTVWAADSRSGFHGGASFTRRVRNDEEFETTRAHFASSADSARIMPFLRGIPCSIHGIVLPDYVAVLRPCEMLVFGRPDGTFQYGQVGTFWDPPPAERDAMRAVARQTGEYLRSRYAYRGAFTIDGVLTAEGFRPTELNPRFGAALNTQARALDLPLLLVNFAIVDGEPLDWRGSELESLLLETADRERSGRTMAIVKPRITETITADLCFEGGRFRRARAGESRDASAVLGPNSAGGVVFIVFEPERTPIGPSLAPRAAAALAWADEEWNLEIGPLDIQTPPGE